MAYIQSVFNKLELELELVKAKHRLLFSLFLSFKLRNEYIKFVNLVF